MSVPDRAWILEEVPSPDGKVGSPVSLNCEGRMMFLTPFACAAASLIAYTVDRVALDTIVEVMLSSEDLWSAVAFNALGL